MRTLIVVAALFAVICSSACNPYAETDAIVVAHNMSNDRIEVSINAGGHAEIPANGLAQFTIKILVPRNPVSSINGPSIVDKTVRVSVDVKNLRTGRLISDNSLCRAGAKVVTNVWYEVISSSGRENIHCQSSYY